ncbi:Histidine phosphatase superfamily [Naviculisporaceae sp. PSN 640]
MKQAILLLLSCLQLGAGQTVLGAYIFHRHGDRTSKSLPPVLLTPQGADQSRRSGAWYRHRYVAGNASSKIHGISSDIVDLSQISAASPVDDILQSSAQAFLQGLYPPVSNRSSDQSAGVDALLDGYQFIPINIEGPSTNNPNSEANMWLQSGSACPRALQSTKSYFESSDYLAKLKDTKDFYEALLPVYENTFPRDEASFEQAYAIYDLVHVSTLPPSNSKISHPELLTPEAQAQLYTLASAHEWGLAYNSSERIRAVAGSILAGQIVQKLNATLQTPLSNTSTNRLTIQFGPYATFMSFFGLSQAPRASTSFYGIVDYASSFVIELVTDATIPSSPAADNPVNPEDVYIRFLFANGAASEENPPQVFPLFGQPETKLEWSTFVDEMAKFSFAKPADWCTACGVTGGICSTENTNDDGTSYLVVGVNGAVIILVVVLILVAVTLWPAVLRIVKKEEVSLSRAARAEQCCQRDV